MPGVVPQHRDMFATMEKADGELVLHPERVFPDDQPVTVVFHGGHEHPDPKLILSDPKVITQIRINQGPWITVGTTIISIFKEDIIRFRQLPGRPSA